MDITKENKKSGSLNELTSYFERLLIEIYDPYRRQSSMSFYLPYLVEEVEEAFASALYLRGEGEKGKSDYFLSSSEEEIAERLLSKVDAWAERDFFKGEEETKYLPVLTPFIPDLAEKIGEECDKVMGLTKIKARLQRTLCRTL